MANNKQSFSVDAGAATTTEGLQADQLLYIDVCRFVTTELRDIDNQSLEVAAIGDTHVENGRLRVQLHGLDNFHIGRTIQLLTSQFGPGSDVRVQTNVGMGVETHLLVPLRSRRLGRGRGLLSMDTTTLVMAMVLAMFLAYLWRTDSDMLLIRSLKALHIGILEAINALLSDHS